MNIEIQAEETRVVGRLGGTVILQMDRDHWGNGWIVTRSSTIPQDATSHDDLEVVQLFAECLQGVIDCVKRLKEKEN